MTQEKTPMIQVSIPSIFKGLLTSKKRVKLFYGGRSGGKSYAFADSLLLKGRLAGIDKGFILIKPNLRPLGQV